VSVRLLSKGSVGQSPGRKSNFAKRRPGKASGDKNVEFSCWDSAKPLKRRVRPLESISA